MQTTFQRKSRNSLIYYVFLFLAGLATLILRRKGIYTNDTYTGLGFGILAVSLVRIVQWSILLRNHEKQKCAEIQQTDERNIFIAKEAYAGFAALSFLFQFLLILVVGIFAPEFGTFLSFVLSGNALLLYLCFLYFHKKY